MNEELLEEIRDYGRYDDDQPWPYLIYAYRPIFWVINPTYYPKNDPVIPPSIEIEKVDFNSDQIRASAFQDGENEFLVKGKCRFVIVAPFNYSDDKNNVAVYPVYSIKDEKNDDVVTRFNSKRTKNIFVIPPQTVGVYPIKYSWASLTIITHLPKYFFKQKYLVGKLNTKGIELLTKLHKDNFEYIQNTLPGTLA